MGFKHLKFFDKKGERYNFAFDGEIFEGSIFLPEVSVELIENDHIFIVEEFQDGSGATKFGSPLADTFTSPSDPKWRLRWEEKVVEEEDEEKIFIYTIVDEFVEADQKSFPFIQKFSTLEIEVDQLPFTVDSTTERKVVSDLDLIESSSVPINIGISSTEEEVIERTLIIEDISGSEPITIAKILVHGETVAEDIRFRLLLENFGRVFNEQDAFILRNYDIKEGKPDFKDINRKRKELLLVGEEIFPFLGSYKGLINAIRFFEYQDLRVKEYWLNINPDSENFDKFQLVELTGLLEKGSRDVMLINPLTPNPNYKKTSLFSLVYDITRTTGELDQFGIPITENAFIFTPEEVLIKLFALKERLKRDFLPLNARIFDITGEGIYFDAYRQRSWNHQLETNRIQIGEEVDFECEPACGFIQDLRVFNTKKFPTGLDFPIQRFTNTVEPYEFAQKYPVGAVPELLNSIRQFYKDTENGLIQKFGDEEPFVSIEGNTRQINAGMPIIFSNKSLDLTWDELDVSWDGLFTKPLIIKVSFSNTASPVSTSVTVGLTDQITGNSESVVVGSTPSGADLAAALAPIVSSSSEDPFVDFNILFTPGDDFFLMRDKTRSDVKFGFIPFAGAEDFMTIERFDDQCGLTWDTLGIGQFFEIEWTIEKPAPNPFFFQIRGLICDYNEMPFFLPNEGKYKVTMKIFDLFNNISTNIKEQCVEVFPKELEINTFARFRNRETYTWDDMINTWDEYGGSSWEYITEGTDIGEAPIPEFLVDFRRYKYQNIEYLDEETQTFRPYNAFDFPTGAPDALRSWGTKALIWDNIDASWDDMFHTTWEQLDYHGGFLGGFEIWDPQAGDILKVGPFEEFIIGAESPLTSPFGLQEIVDELNATAAAGISNFTYTVMEAATSSSQFAPSPIPGGQYIQADAKFTGADGYFFIEYTASSPSVSGADPYSFRFPNWLDRPVLETYERFLTANPGVNRDFMFLSAPEADLISGVVGSNAYWFNSPFDKENSPPEPGTNSGQLISWAGNASFTSSDIRGFKNDFVSPIGVPIFFVTDHSQVFGKQNIRWILFKQGDDGRTQNKIIELRGQPFFIWRFEEAGDYTLELFATDINNNEYQVKRNGLIRIINKEEWERKVDGVPINAFQDFSNEVINFQ